MAQMNKKAVLDIIRTKGPINKSEIAKLVELSIPTVMKISDDLTESGLIHVVGKGESNGGKRPELLGMISNAYYMVGVDIGRSKTIAIIMNLNGDIIYKKKIKTGNTNPAIELLERTTEIINQTILESKISINKILGIGIVTPGLIDYKNGVVIFSPDFQWENVNIKKHLGNAFEIPIHVESSNRAMALGEGWFGAAEKSKYFICINLGHGIGSAIMEKGDFYRGNSGSSGEIGHITLEKDGPICDCGNRGCLEALASGNAIAERAKKYINDGKSTEITKFIENGINNIEAKEVFDAAKTGDLIANKIIDEAIEYLGIGIANYINLLDPDLIVLAGGMVNAGDCFIDKVKESIKRRQMKFAGTNVRLEVTKLGMDAAAIGAASIILRKIIENGGNTSKRRKKNE
ncbi:MAG TPA: ROK family transcriptional regulator [Clostridiales bacterium]|nr:ROK family transcriptional regulator [Clostridiales bacterium]